MSAPSYTARVRELLASPRLVWAIVALALILGLPTLDIGLVGDDLAQAEFLTAQREGSSAARWMDMFTLVAGTDNEALRAVGRLPWWVDPELRVAFWRPLSVATHHLDHRLWPGSPWLMHLHSVLWYALACALAWALARRLASDPAAAGAAALIYTVSFSHVIPVAWLAHRNGVVVTTFALACLLAHDRWRRDRSRAAGALAGVALLAALLAGEAGIVTLALLLAYALVLEAGRPLGSRLASLIPAVVLVVGWRLAYDALGYGTHGSGAYLDPMAAPGSFVAALPGRLALLLGLSFGPPFTPEIPATAWLLLTLANAALLLGFAARGGGPARWGLLAAGLGLIPLSASVPFDRLLVLTSFGVALAWGELVGAWLLRPDASRVRRLVAGAALVVQILVPAALFVVAGPRLSRLQLDGEGFGEFASLAIDDLDHKRLVVVHTPFYSAADYLPRALAARGQTPPIAVHVLHAGLVPPRVQQIDAHSLELSSPIGWPSDAVTNFWRDPIQAPFEVGEQITTADYTAFVREVVDGKPTRVLFRFERPLDDPTLAWISWIEGENRVVEASLWCSAPCRLR